MIDNLEMENHLAQPTSYPAINALLHHLYGAIQSILGDHLVGLYLYGSLASGDFNEETSDIDFLVVTSDPLADDEVAALQTMHQQLTASGLQWAGKLEGSYVPQPALRRYDANAPACPQINEGHFYLAQQESDWIIQRHILRTQGVIVAGPPLAPMIDPVQPEELGEAVRGFLREWWAPMLENPTRLQSAEYQAYAVLSMCRALHTLETGTIVSKPIAAHWAQEKFGEPRASLIADALAWRKGMPFDELDAVLLLIRYTVEYSASKDHLSLKD